MLHTAYCTAGGASIILKIVKIRERYDSTFNIHVFQSSNKGSSVMRESREREIACLSSVIRGHHCQQPALHDELLA
jgi:hypothetical protein